ncbi:MAG TPA: hypothetical protein VNA28_12790 [Solirubrobacteraceae bacterium]|nr:hypothetical protein [Solirubrobacteraceae bacterium]
MSRSVDIDDPADVREHLELLRIEHRLAAKIGLDSDPQYMADLERQLEIWEAAWVTANVTEIAVTMAQRQGRQQG